MTIVLKDDMRKDATLIRVTTVTAHQMSRRAQPSTAHHTKGRPAYELVCNKVVVTTKGAPALQKLSQNFILLIYALFPTKR